jgi:hypothetical protein
MEDSKKAIRDRLVHPWVHFGGQDHRGGNARTARHISSGISLQSSVYMGPKKRVQLWRARLKRWRALLPEEIGHHT